MRKHSNFKAILSFMTAIVLFLSADVGAPVAHAEEKIVTKFKFDKPQSDNFSDIPTDLSDKTVIVMTNDVHGAIDKYPYVAALKKNLKNERNASDVILVDCGDFSQDKKKDHAEDSLGVVDATKGTAAIDSMNAAGYDLATIGNHEFEVDDSRSKIANLSSNLSAGNFRTICANIVEKDKAEDLNNTAEVSKDAFNDIRTFVSPNFIYDKKIGTDESSAVKIGFFGMTSPDSKSFIKTKDYGILKSKIKNGALTSNALYVCAQDQIDKLKEEKVDLIICLSHLGLEDEVEGSRSCDLYDNTKGIDLILDAHSHTKVNGGENGEPILSGEMQCHFISIVIIDNDSKEIEKKMLISKDGDEGYMENLSPDPETLAVVQPLIDKYGKKANAESTKDSSLKKDDKKHNSGNKYKFGFGG